MVTNTTIYTRQIYCTLHDDPPPADIEFHNGDELVIIDQDTRMIFDEENQTWRQIPMSGSGGGGVTVNPLSITENGTYTAPTGTAYNPVTVNVPSETDQLPAAIQAQITSYTNNNITSFKLFRTLEHLVALNVTTVEGVWGAASAAAGNSAPFVALKSICMPKANIATSSAFAYMKNLSTAVIKGVSSSSIQGPLRANTVMTAADISGTSISAPYFFAGCTTLTTVILRNAGVVATGGASAAGTFTGTPFANGGTGGMIYIPKALYDHLGDGSSLDYKAATNWSTIDGYGTITWAQIEGSIYETQYADGTPIPTT